MPRPSEDQVRRKRRRGLLEQTEAQFQESVVQYATLMGWKLSHDTATNTPIVCSRCARLNRVDHQNRRIRYACPTCERPSPNIRNKPGWPDWWLVRAPRVVVAELKADYGAVSDEQRDWLLLLEQCPGIETYIWRPSDWREIEEVLRPE